MYVQTYFLSQLRKMLILLISSYCKMCTLPTLQSRVFVCCEQYKHARSYCWQWTHFTMWPNEQNQHFAELRQKNCLYIHVVVLLTCLPSLDGKLERFVTKKWQKWLPNSSQTDYIRKCPLTFFAPVFEHVIAIPQAIGAYYASIAPVNVNARLGSWSLKSWYCLLCLPNSVV